MNASYPTRLRLAWATGLLAVLTGCTTAPPLPLDANGSVVHPGMEWVDTRADLKLRLGEHPDIERQAMDDGALLIRLPAAEGFARDSVEPEPELAALIDAVADALADDERILITVLGHTDSHGNELYNLRLSIDRAEAVMDRLQSAGVSLARLKADGRGEAEPIADNRSEEGRARNRRVEFVLRPAP